MTIQYEVCRKKTGNANYNLAVKNGEEVVTKSIQVTYRVHARDPADPNFGPADVDEEMVRTSQAQSTGTATFNNRVPIVGDTVFESADTLIYPWYRCTQLGVTRNQQSGTEFTVVATFSDMTGTHEPGMLAPSACEDIDPIITYSTEPREVSAWTEDASLLTAGGPVKLILPTGSLYSNPPVKVIPEQIITFSQYESTFGVEQYLERIYTLNRDIWTVDTSQPSSNYNLVAERHAFIADIAYENTTIPGAAGTITCVRVTYTIRVRDWSLVNLLDDGSTTDIFPGYDNVRARIDTRYVDNSDSQNPKVVNASNNESWGTAQTYLETDGTPFDNQYQRGIPPYDILKAQKEIEFGYVAGPPATGFLR
jgi:hypothetical protein